MNLPSPLESIRAAFPPLLTANPRIAALTDRAALLLHGSTTIGVDDAHADWDLWLLTDAATRHAFNCANGTCFVEFTTPHAGHFQVESLNTFHRRMAACDFELLSELRHAVALRDPANVATALLADARKPMREDVRRAWFRYHYVEMRGEHRLCDNAINRSDAGGDHRFALLGGVTRTLKHALQAAMILDREPYRYGKWLRRMAAQTPTGARVVPLVDDATNMIGAGALTHPGPEESHPLTLTLKGIRRCLVDAARAGGIDEPWLTEWWLHIDNARSGVKDVTW